MLWKVNQKKKINFKLHHNPFAADDGTAFLQVQMELIQWQYNGDLFLFSFLEHLHILNFYRFDRMYFLVISVIF